MVRPSGCIRSDQAVTGAARGPPFFSRIDNLGRFAACFLVVCLEASQWFRSHVLSACCVWCITRSWVQSRGDIPSSRRWFWYKSEVY